MDIVMHNDLELCYPPYPEKKNVDFLSYFGEKTNHSLIVSKILGYCNGSDLMNIARVCRAWKKICFQDKAAVIRMKLYIAKRNLTKENQLQTHNSIQYNNESTPKKRRPLSCWNENFNFSHKKQSPGSPPVSPRRMKFFKYVQEAKKLGRNGKLTPCPKCSLPSKVNEEERSGQCTQFRCAFLFCLQCQCSFHKGTACKYFITSSPSSSPSKVSHHIIGSRQSKKALRRL
ncbi:UNVERIFIED_CONTAM: hypothetical protein PYX00_010622 [Menopon gallinae]|uniref:ZBR-type domain-containing protein n=1 Tax=Menopon gallinae TaxID=328185 RepID=A0AAW2HG00_9NEOP